MSKIDFTKAKAHEVLSGVGKKVLRPGGKELTKKMIDALEIKEQDKVVEIAPGMGYTARMCISCCPQTYIGVDCDCKSVHHLRDQITSAVINIRFIEGKGDQTTIEDNSKDKVYGEAIMTMHANQAKKRFIREAHRILKDKGWYAIHELALKDGLSEEDRNEMMTTLAKVMKVNAKPLTISEWSKLLEDEGFTIKKVATNRMLLLQFPRILFDEGIQGIAKIALNILTNKGATKRVFSMRKTFMKYEKNIQAVMIIAEKN